MARFKIISKDGQSVRYEGKPRYNGTYLKPSCLEFGEISSPTPIAWEVGDYVDYSRTGMKYYLYSIPQPSKNAKKGTHGGAFTYSAVQFHAASKELEIALFRDIVDADNGVHFSTSPDVATFEDVYGIARRIQACMDDIYPGRWNIRVADFSDAEAIENVSTAKDFALSGGTCLDALSKIYELWQDIGWIHTHEDGVEVITIGYSNSRVEDNTTDPFICGKGNGLTAIRKSQSNKDEFATRLYVYGSDRNLPARYYNGFGILNAESVDIRNLMLPISLWGTTDGKPDASKAYLENADAVAKYGIIPKVHYFDSEGAGADIHPTIERMTVGEVRKFVSGNYSPSFSIYPVDSERVDEILDAVNPDDDGVENRDGNVFDKTEKVQFSMLTRDVDVVEGSTRHFIASNLELMSCTFAGTGEGRITFEPNIKGYVMDKGYKSVNVRVVLSNIKDETLARGYQSIDIKAVNNGSGAWDFTLPKMSTKYKEVESDTFVAKVYISIDAELSAPGTATEASFTIMAGSAVFGFSKVLPKTFELRLKQIGFNINERASVGSGKTISMKTGMCAGRDFVISDCRYNEITDSWVLDCRRQKDETLGTLFPNADYPIYGGDRFVLTDIAMPDLYISIAMDRLLAEGQKLLDKVSRIQSNYKPMIDAKVMAEQKRSIREGMYMEISDDDVIDNKTDYILIDTLSIYEDESAIPTYEVTLRERRKVTYKGTPSATSESRTSPAAPDEEDNSTDSSLLRALEHLKDMFYWHDEAKTTIGTKYNFFSEKTVASGGKGKEGEGSGSGVVVLEDWGKYDATLPQVLGAALGLELHNRLTAVEDGQVDIDLSAYATIDYVTQAIDDLVNGAPAALDTLKEIADVLQGNVNSIADILTAIETKANKTEVEALKAVDDEIRAALNEIDADIEALQNKDSEINTSLTEINDKITAIEGDITSIETLLEGKVSTDAFNALEERVGVNETDIKALKTEDTNIKEQISELKEITDLFHIDAEGNIYVDENFYSKKTVASGGKGTAGTGGGTGTVMAVSVNGTTYDSVDGIVTIPDYPTKVSQLGNDMSYATTVQLTTDLMSKQDRITADNPLSAELISGLGSLAYKSSLAASDIPDLSGKYLPLSGGTITGGARVLTIKRDSSGLPSLVCFANMDGTLGFLGVDANGDGILYDSALSTKRTFLHSGNYQNYALPLTGGTINGALTFVVYNAVTTNEGINFGQYAHIGASVNVLGLYSQNYIALRPFGKIAGGEGLEIKDDAVLFNNNILLHSGNVGKYALKIDGSNEMTAPLVLKHDTPRINFRDASNLYGSVGFKSGKLKVQLIIGGSWSWYTLLHTGNIKDTNISLQTGLYTYLGAVTDAVDSTTEPNVLGYSSVHNNFVFADTKFYSSVSASSNRTQMLYGYNDDVIKFRRYSDGKWYDAKTIAFTDSTVAAAYKLVTTSGADAVTITEEGYVGIGTPGGLAKLNINGGVLVYCNYPQFSAISDLTWEKTFSITRGSRVASPGGAGMFMWIDGRGGSNIQSSTVPGETSAAYALNLNPFGGAVNVGEGGLNVAGAITTNDRIFTPLLFLGMGQEGIYVANDGISWHNANNAWSSTLLKFSKDLVRITQAAKIEGNAQITGNLVVTGNTTHTGWAYFANGTSYYVNAGGAAKFASLTTGAITASAITASGRITANAGLTVPTGQTLTIGSVTLSYDGSALKITGNAYATGTLASGGRATAGTTVGLSTGDIMPAQNYQYYIGTTQNYYIGMYANSLFCGASTNNMNLIGGNGSTYGVRFRLSNFATTPTYTELGYWNASGMTINTKLKIGTVDVGAKLTELENRIAAIGG